MDLLNKYILHKELGFSPLEIDELPLEDIDGFLFIVDAVNKKAQLGEMTN